MKKRITTFFLFIILIVGVSLLLYPTIADYFNSLTQTGLIASYVQQTSNMSKEEYEQMYLEAVAYNEKLFQESVGDTLEEDEMQEYLSTLDCSGTGVMGYIDIPCIKCELPIYHGTDDSVLEIAVGHIEWSSLPVGGENTHTVLSGHRGLPSAKLFTDIDQLVVGDIFFLNILGDTLAYEVDQILIVLPEEMSSLAITPGKDLCTLVTCTPYGVNTHRLLVRGHRIDYKNNNVRVTADAMQIDTMIVAPFVAAPILIVLFILLLTRTGKKKQKR